MWAELRSWASVEDYIPQCSTSPEKRRQRRKRSGEQCKTNCDWQVMWSAWLTEDKSCTHWKKKSAKLVEFLFAKKFYVVVGALGIPEWIPWKKINWRGKKKKKKQSLNIHRMFTLTWSGDNPDPTLGKRIRGELLNVDEWSVYKCPVIGAFIWRTGIKTYKYDPRLHPKLVCLSCCF